MKHLRIILYSLSAVAFLAIAHFTNLHPGAMLGPIIAIGACAELTAFATATESLDQRIIKSPRLGRAKFWWNAVPHGTFVKNQGVTRTTFSMKPSEPQDDPSAWADITLDDSSGQPTPSCSTDFEDIDVGYYRRTYGPKRRDFRGPVLCKRDFTFQHDIDAFLDGYVDEMGRYMTRIWEFALRDDYMNFGDVFVDYVKYYGPNALATVPLPRSDLTQDMLDDVATDEINVGGGVVDGNGYVMEGETGPIFSLYIDMRDSANILKNNSERREDARFAAMGKGKDSDFSLWKEVGANRVIGNFRHIVTDIAPRFENVNGVAVPVQPFRTISEITSNGEVLTAAYKAARYRAAIVVLPGAMTAEIVSPTDWQFPTMANYMGDLQFKVGGNLICDPPVYDPLGERGRHFANIEYAPRPDRPYLAKSILYKHCPTDEAESLCNTYT